VPDTKPARVSSLDVRVLGANDGEPLGTALRVRAPSMPFAPVQPTVDSELWSAIANATSDGIFSAAPMRPGPFETLVALEEGAATLGGLTPGVELELTAVDALLQPLATQRVVTPRAGERADVELRVADAQRPRGRAGRVVDASGRGLPRAEVRLDKDFFDDRVDFTVTTDADGRFALPIQGGAPTQDSRSGAWLLQVTRPGFVTIIDGKFVLPAPE
jgi:hypothetical protein